MTPRTILAVTGRDRERFLDGLVTNRLPAPGEGLTYAALLTPQGKYLADFFLLAEPDRILLDVATPLVPGLVQRLSMYKLRADVAIEDTELRLRRGTGAAPPGAWPDPRHPEMGWRLYGPEEGEDGTDFDALRVRLMVPEAGTELTPDSYILEMGFERLHGVDFRKGCYVGQEVTARMKHKTELKKGLVRVRLDGPAAPGDEIQSDGKPAGRLHTVSGDTALAWMRLDRAGGDLRAGQTDVKLDTDPTA